MSGFYPAIEAISFQNNSQLAADIVNIFQTCIDIRAVEYSSNTERIDAVITHFKKNACQQLMVAIEKHTGIEVEKVYVQSNFNLYFACLMHVGDKYGLTAHDIIERYSGLKQDQELLEIMQWLDIEPSTADEMEKIASSLVKKTGMIRERMFRKNEIHMDLYFDPYSAFLTKETGHNKFEYFTAEELAAVVLHEVGHMMTLLEHSADYYFRLKAYEKAGENFLKKATKEEKIKYAKRVIEQQYKKKPDYEGVSSNTSSTNPVMFVLDLLLVMFCTVFITLLFPLILVSDLLGRMEEETNLALLAVGKKRSDFSGTRMNMKYGEMLADEYVARHGLSGPLTSGLQKMMSISTVFHFESAVNSSTVYYLSKIPWIIQTMLLGDMSSGMGQYDRQVKRIEQAMLNTLKAFRNSDMPPEVLDVYIKDYEKTKAVLDKRGLGEKFTEGSELVHRLIVYLISPSSLVQMISSGRFSQEYDKLAERVDKLTANKLLYRAAKLEQLINRKYNV